MMKIFCFCIFSVFCNNAFAHGFFHISLAGGWTHANISSACTKKPNSIMGPGFAVSMEVGSMVTERFALHGSLLHVNILAPKANGASKEGHVRLIGIGMGMTYVTNVFISVVAGFGQVSLDTNFATGQSEWGAIGQFKIGKKWLISENTAFGVSVHLTSTIVNDGSNSVLTWVSGGVGPSLMFN